MTQLAEILEPPVELRRFTAAEMSSSPAGDPVHPRFQIKEILTRYEPEHPVHRAVSRSGPDPIATAEEVATLLS